MGRIRTNIKINGNDYWALFDSGSRNNYIVLNGANNLTTFKLDSPQHVSLGGKEHNVIKNVYINCLINGLPVIGLARILEDIGSDDGGKRIDVIIGALTMQEWGIRLNLEDERLDMTHYPKEFVEF